MALNSRTGIRRKLNLVLARALIDEYCQNIKRSATLAVIKRRQLLEFKHKARCVNWLPLPDWQDHTAKTAAKVPALSSWRPCLRLSKLGSLCRGQRPLSLANTFPPAGGHVCVAHYRYGSTVVKLTPLL
jgi:hypothetical protein